MIRGGGREEEGTSDVEMRKGGKNLWKGRAGPGREVDYREGKRGLERDKEREN